MNAVDLKHQRRLKVLIRNLKVFMSVLIQDSGLSQFLFYRHFSKNGPVYIIWGIPEYPETP